MNLIKKSSKIFNFCQKKKKKNREFTKPYEAINGVYIINNFL